MPLETAVDRVYQAVAKFAGEYRSDQNKLLGGMVVTGVLGLPVFFPFGVSSLLIAGAVAASAFQWQELGTMRDRLKPEYQVLKGSVLLEQFIKWLAQELRERRGQFAESNQFLPDAIATANILAAYEDTVFAVTNGEHLENNASDPILALFVLKLRQHTNHLPSWVMDAFRQLEQAEVQRATDVDRASRYMWGNLEQRYPEHFNQQPQQTSVGQNTRIGAVEVPVQPIQGEGEQRLGKLLPPTEDSVTESQPDTDTTSGKAGIEILDALASTRRSTLLIGDTGAGKSVTQSYVLTKLFEWHPNAEVFVLSQKADSFCGLAEKGRVILFDPTSPEQALILIGNIWKLYDKRRRLPESERSALPPVRLILADWLSINQALEELKNEESVKTSKYLTKLADIIYNGRELNVCLLVDLQSYNLAAVGLKADRNSRKNFNLIGLGNYSVDELGMVNESYGVLTNLIGDRYIVADESERSSLNATFKRLQPISKALRRPIIFSGLSPARLALLPDLREYKMSVGTTSKQPVTVIETTDERQPDTDAIASTEPTIELKVSDSLAEPLKSIWLFTKEQKEWVTVRDIQRKNFAVLKGKSSEQIHQYLGLLADGGYGEIDEEGKSHSSVAFLAH
jgi:hypothetical protein